MNTQVARRRHPAALMLLLLGALAIIATIYALVNTSTAARAAGSPHSETAVEEGKALYLEGCASCHGLNAEGTSVAPSLIGAGAASVHFQVSTGRMPLAAPAVQVERKEPSYTEPQIAALAAYIATLGPWPGDPHGRAARHHERRPRRRRGALPHELRPVPQLRRQGCGAHSGQVRAEPHGGNAPAGVRGDADRSAEHAGVRRRHRQPRRRSRTSSSTSRTCRPRPSPADGPSARSAP